MNWHTRKFLRLCKVSGYKLIGINRCEGIDDYYFYNSEYVCGLKKKNKTANYQEWPAIWECVERTDVSRGAGNGHSHQIKPNYLDSGIYDLTKLKF